MSEPTMAQKAPFAVEGKPEKGDVVCLRAQRQPTLL